MRGEREESPLCGSGRGRVMCGPTGPVPTNYKRAGLLAGRSRACTGRTYRPACAVSSIERREARCWSPPSCRRECGCSAAFATRWGRGRGSGQVSRSSQSVRPSVRPSVRTYVHMAVSILYRRRHFSMRQQAVNFSGPARLGPQAVLAGQRGKWKLWRHQQTPPRGGSSSPALRRA